MRKIFARFNVEKDSEVSSNIRYQQFTTAWAGITELQEILKLRCDEDAYFDGETPTGDNYIETFFTEKEAIFLEKKFPQSFKVLQYA